MKIYDDDFWPEFEGEERPEHVVRNGRLYQVIRDASGVVTGYYRDVETGKLKLLDDE